MRLSVGVLGGTLGLVLACGGGAQSEEDGLAAICAAVGSCTSCSPEADDYLVALRDHAAPTVTNPDASAVLGALAESAVHESAAVWREASSGKVGNCALGPVLDSRRKAFLTREVARLCALHTTCETFDGTDPASVVACAKDAVAEPVGDEVARMDLRSNMTLAKSLDAYSAKHTTAGCALSIVLRDAR
jgi:hypothetical protein